MRLIDADELKTAIRDDVDINGRNYAAMKRHIDEAPTVEAEPVVHAHWIKKPWLLGVSCFCSRCGENYGMPYERCPHCGAHMNEVAHG